MMWPFVIHSLKKFFAGIFVTETAEFYFFIQRTIPEFTISDAIIYRRLPATGAVFCTTGTAEKATRAALYIFRHIVHISPNMSLPPIPFSD